MIFSIVVTYNGEKYIRKCLNSLLSSSVKVEIIVIDNNSVDSTCNIIQESFTGVKLIRLKENTGFAAANNIGIKKAITLNSEFLFLLNQDAWVETDTIEKLIIVAKQNPQFGIISPVHLNGSYNGLDIKFANYLVPQECAGFLSDLFIGKLKEIYEAQFVNAAAWLMAVKPINDVGLFDPLFYFYGEDNNYLQRLKYHGYKAGITPTCTICHDREIRKGNLNPVHQKQWERIQSFIILLDIQHSFKECVFSFLYKQMHSVARFTADLKLSYLKYPFNELLYFFTHINKLRSVRNKYKQKPASNELL